MNTARRPVSHRQLPDWLTEDATAVDEGGHGRRGIVQFIGEWGPLYLARHRLPSSSCAPKAAARSGSSPTTARTLTQG
ncbi:hypothetical protein [Streptomyces daghestanicus]|nr:hypothetical protein [Streptomyces daghestanicus]GGU69142.1 hypothetical protein GCM10010259_68750 [Streptomyces daghestanicus]